jgi:hypothetical protein
MLCIRYLDFHADLLFKLAWIFKYEQVFRP